MSTVVTIFVAKSTNSVFVASNKPGNGYAKIFSKSGQAGCVKQAHKFLNAGTQQEESANCRKLLNASDLQVLQTTSMGRGDAIAHYMGLGFTSLNKVK